MISLSPEAEVRAQRLHRDSLVMICHDHNLSPDSQEAMARGGVTAKLVHVCVDGLIWADRERFLASRSDTEGYLRRALIAMDYIYRQAEARPDKVVIAREPDDLMQTKATGSVALLLGAEGARLIEGRLEVLHMLCRMGLRHLQLSWAWETPVGTPQRDTSGRGLGPFGRDLIQELNRLGIIVDVSHLSYRSILDALEVSSQPLLNSHSGALALSPEQPQLLPDDVLRAMAARGGVIGIHFMSQMVKPGRQKATTAQLMRQFEYLATLIGPDHIACGPDYMPLDPRLWENQGISEPFEYAEGVEDVSQMLNVTRGLVGLGFSDDEVRKMMGGNLFRLFHSVRAGADLIPGPPPETSGELGTLTGGTAPL